MLVKTIRVDRTSTVTITLRKLMDGGVINYNSSLIKRKILKSIILFNNQQSIGK